MSLIKEAIKEATKILGAAVQDKQIHFIVIAVEKTEEGFTVGFGSDITDPDAAIDFGRTFLNKDPSDSQTAEIMHVNRKTGEVTTEPVSGTRH